MNKKIKNLENYFYTDLAKRICGTEKVQLISRLLNEYEIKLSNREIKKSLNYKSPKTLKYSINMNDIFN